MSNVNAPFGLTPIRYAWGAPYNGACRQYFATGASGAIYVGDPVTIAGSSNTSAFQGWAPGTLPTVAPTTAGDGNVISGVCVGVQFVTHQSTTYRADSTDRIIFVADDPNLIFVGQTDAASTAWAATDVGSYANLLTGSGSIYTGKSGYTLDTSDGPATGDVSNQLLIVGLYPAPDNAIGAYSRWEVLINTHTYGSGAAATYGRFTGV